MCSSKSQARGGGGGRSTGVEITHINGRPVLQPAACNRVSILERRNSLHIKKTSLPKSSSTPNTTATTTTTKLQTCTTTRPSMISSSCNPPISPKLIKSPRQAAVKRSGNNDPNGLNSSVEKITMVSPRKSVTLLKKPKIKSSSTTTTASTPPSVDTTAAAAAAGCPLKYSSSLIVEAPGSIAAARREQVAIMQVQRKMKIAHYGRTKSSKFEPKLIIPFDPLAAATATATATATVPQEKRCTFITSNSDPIYVAYHDEEWGVPVHDDKMLFELLVLTGAQVGSDWTSVLKKRQAFRDAFSGFDAEIVSKFSEKKITSISADYGINISQVRGIVDNANRVLEIKREMGSFDKYIWGFVNDKPIETQYKSSNKIPVKNSRSEGISKDMVRRGFRLVGPTVVHSFMQAAGLTNDHLITCTRHLRCVALASSSDHDQLPLLN